ncbi:hypothetical protein [Roseateles sp. P5_E1]
MHMETVTFTRVFDVVRRQSKLGSWTDFGFNSPTCKIFGARVWGHPPLRDGMTVKLVLQRADHWSTILGWQDMQTGETCIANRGGALLGVGLIATAFYLLAGPLLLPRLLTGSGAARLFDACVLALPAALVLIQLRGKLQHAAVVRMLQQAA